MLSDEERNKVREAIKQKIEILKNSIAKLREQSKPVAPDNAIGRITRMDAIQQKNMAEAALRKAEEDKPRLEDALSRIDDPDYGICVRCRQPIPAGRILIMPETRTCVQCAQ